MKGLSVFRRGVAVVAATAALGVGVGQADATITSIPIAGDLGSGTEGIGSFSGFVSYEILGSEAGLLTIGLENTSPTTPLFLTGFVFNVDLPGANSFNLTPGTFGNTNFAFVTDENAAPFGTFEYGAAVGGNWSGGGQPSQGISQGDGLVTFEFETSGTLASSLTADSFMSKTSSQGEHDEVFLVRFRGGEGEPGSDKVPGHVVPLPAAAWGGLALLGMLGVGQRIRKRRLSEAV